MSGLLILLVLVVGSCGFQTIRDGDAVSTSISAGSRCCRETLGTPAPVDDFGFVDHVAQIVGSSEARSSADGTIDIDRTATDAADEMVVVITDPIFKAGR